MRSDISVGTAQIIRANSLDLPLADNSVDLVVTSPPYFALRSYQDGGEHYAGQIGDEPTPAEFVESLLEVTRECVRVLKPSGSLWVNLGDKYSRGSRGRGQVDQFRDGAPITYDDPRYVKDLSPEGTGYPGKSLIGIPWRYALRCIDDLGLILRAEVIWSKPNGLPESVTDRVRRSHEQWFHFTLNPRYFSAVDEIREGYAPSSLASYAKGGAAKAVTGLHPSSANGSQQGDIPESWSGNPLGKLPGSVWTIPTQPLRVPEHLGVDHFAAFPMEWPRRIIQGWAPTRGVCVECGEGRRPTSVALGEGAHDRVKRIGHNGYAAESHSMSINHKGSHAQGARQREITGEACACPEPTWETSRDSGVCTTCDMPSDWADACSQGCELPSLPPTRPAVVLDPFGGTGTTALVAKALGCHGISVDMSADYCRLAQWRTNDEGELARALHVDKPAKQIDGQGSLLDLLDGGAA